MKPKTLKFNIALFTLVTYELAMLFLGLDGVSLLKLAITGLVWVSFFIAFFEYFNSFKVLKKSIPQIAWTILNLLLVWNVYNVFRSIINQDGPLTTILGNVAASLAILVPFAIIFSIRKSNLRIIHSYFIKILKFGILVFVVLIAFKGSRLNSPHLPGLLILFLPVAFLITVLPFETKKNRLIILVCIPLLFYSAYLLDNRTTVIRLALLFGSLCAIYLFYKFKSKWILGLSFLLLLVPWVLLQQSIVTGDSAFEKYLDDSSEDDLSIDTRTFLYMEIFEDLLTNDKLVIGKGSNGSYYSEYFYNSDVGETHNRNNVEVGVLGILLKGGLIAVFLNIIIMVIAIYLAFFRSNNIYVVGIGYILIIHNVLLFIENYTIYSSYNFTLWFFIGVCLSKEIRKMNNTQIKVLIHPKKILK